MLETLEQIIRQLVLDQPLFWVTAIGMAIFGRFMSKKVFTKSRALRPGAMRWFWFWAEESLSIHPIIIGILLGVFVVDPFGLGWSRKFSMVYFAGAGTTASVIWTAFETWARWKGIRVFTPGDSFPPSIRPTAKDD